MNPDLITAWVALATAVGSGSWAVTRYADEKKEQHAKDLQLAAEQLDQRREEQVRARQDRAAELVKQLGATTDARARRWTMSALSLYPDETLDLLIASLADADPLDATAVKLAVVSIGVDAVPRVVRAHRIARQLTKTLAVPDNGHPEANDQRTVDLASAARVLDCTREILVNLLFQLDDEQRASLDVADVDLSRVMLAEAKLPGLRLRKADLTGAVLPRARMEGVVLRGASLDKAVLSRAVLSSADLTGARGCVRAIRTRLDAAVLDHAQLSGSVFDGARLVGASLVATQLDKASLAGAAFGETRLERTNLKGAQAHHLRGDRITCVGADLAFAVLDDASFRQARFERTKLVRVSALRTKAAGSRFTNCNLGGAQIVRADFDGAEFVGCEFGGVVLRATSLRGAAFRSCHISGADFTGADLAGASFVECTFGTADFTGVDLGDVEFTGCTFERPLTGVPAGLPNPAQPSSLEDHAR